MTRTIASFGISCSTIHSFSTDRPHLGTLIAALLQTNDVHHRITAEPCRNTGESCRRNPRSAEEFPGHSGRRPVWVNWSVMALRGQQRDLLARDPGRPQPFLDGLRRRDSLLSGHRAQDSRCRLGLASIQNDLTAPVDPPHRGSPDPPVGAGDYCVDLRRGERLDGRSLVERAREADFCSTEPLSSEPIETSRSRHAQRGVCHRV